MSGVKLKVGGSWFGLTSKEEIRVKYNGEWVDPSKIFVKVGGTWVEVLIPIDETIKLTHFNPSIVYSYENSQVRLTGFNPSIVYSDNSY